MDYILLALHLLLPAAIGALVAAYLQPVLRDVLIDLCGTAERAAFWGRTAGLALVLFPLAWSLLALNPAPGLPLAALLRQTIGTAVAATLAVVAAAAWIIWRQIRHLPPGTGVSP